MAALDVQGSVELALNDVPLEEALNAITHALNLEWRRILVPQGATRTDIQRMVASTQATPVGNVVVQGTDGRFSAILSGRAAEKLWTYASDLGLQEVIWVSNPLHATVVSSTTASPEQAASEGTNAITPTAVYKNVTKSLSNLEPLDAFNIVDRVREEVVAAMTPYERQMMFGISTEPVPPAWSRNFMSPRIRTFVPTNTLPTYQPGGGGLIINPPYYQPW